MSFLESPKGAKVPNYVSVPIQTSVWTLPIPVGYGTFLCAGNLISYNNFQKKAANSGGKGGGGKGGEDTYSAAIQLALGEGPVSVVKTSTDGVSWEPLSETGFGLTPGDMPSAPWSYLSAKYPSQALSYPGIAILVNSSYQMGSSPQLPSNQIVAQGLLAGSASWASSGEFQTADLGLVIQDILTNPRYGVQGFPSSAINTSTLLSTSAATTTGDNTLQTYCRAMGWGFNPHLDSTETAITVLQRLLQVSNCEAVWSGTALKFIPYGDLTVAANGVTYLPDLTPIYDLGDDDFVVTGNEDPVQITRVDAADVPNILRAEITNNDGYYASYLVEARDQASIELIGERVGSSITAHEILGPGQGTSLLNLLLQRGQGIRNTYAFKCTWEKCLLEPMDLVTLTDLNLGLYYTPVRIVTVDEDNNGVLSFTAEDFPTGLAGPTEYASQTVFNGINSRTTVPASVNPPILFEPPAGLTGGPAEVWVSVSGGTSGIADSFWGGCVVNVSSDNVNYTDLGSLATPARMGTLVTALPAYSGSAPDNTNTLQVNLAESDGELISSTPLNASQGETICYVDGELIAYTTATLVIDNTYNLTGLYRGLSGTTAAAHAAGTQFSRLDDATFIYALPSSWVGNTIYFKFQSFNIWGNGYQDLSTCVVYTYSPSGVAYQIAPPGTPSISKVLTLQPDGTTIITLNIVWSASSGPNVGSYNLIWSSDNGSTYTGGAALGANVTSFQLKAAIPNAYYIFKVQAISINGLAVSAYESSVSYNTGALNTSVPSAPTGLAATPNTSGSVALKWNANASSDGVLNYEVFRDAGPSGTFSGATKLWTGSATGYTDTGLTNGDVYTYFLVAVNSLGASGNSAGVDATAVDNTGTGPSNSYVINGYWAGPLPTASGTVLYSQTMTQTVNFPMGLTGSSFGIFGSGGTIGCKISVNKNGTNVGFVWLLTSGTLIHPMTSATTYNAGDVFSLTVMTNDDSADGFSYSFVGTT